MVATDIGRAFAAEVQALVGPAQSLVTGNLARLDISFVVPDIQLLAMICPSAAEAAAEEFSRPRSKKAHDRGLDREPLD